MWKADDEPNSDPKTGCSVIFSLCSVTAPMPGPRSGSRHGSCRCRSVAHVLRPVDSAAPPCAEAHGATGRCSRVLPPFPNQIEKRLARVIAKQFSRNASPR
jgi:hypothetical protein